MAHTPGVWDLVVEQDYKWICNNGVEEGGGVCTEGARSNVDYGCVRNRDHLGCVGPNWAVLH